MFAYDKDIHTKAAELKKGDSKISDYKVDIYNGFAGAVGLITVTKKGSLLGGPKTKEVYISSQGKDLELLGRKIIH